MDNTEPTEDFLAEFKQHLETFTQTSIDEIIDRLPPMLKTPAQTLVDENERETFLIGSLGVASGLMPNYKGKYGGRLVSPNLFTYILGGYGGGKGALGYARELGFEVHKAKMNEAKDLAINYANELDSYKDMLKKSAKSGDEPPTKPKKPPAKMLFIPSNNSKSGIYQLLEENDGKGILFESEGDTLSDALKQDYGGFSDTLRKAFHGEPLTMFRRLNDEHIEIPNPELSVVLSSTYNQMKDLINSSENGLFSRFLYYEITQNNEFTNVFDSRKDQYEYVFENAATKFRQLYDELDNLPSPIFFSLTSSQQKKFLKVFNNKKAELIDIEESLGGTANRLGIITYRVLMIISALRVFEAGSFDKNIVALNQDFETAMMLIERFEIHARNVFKFIDKGIGRKDTVINMRKSGVSIPKIEKALMVNRGTISRWCKGINPVSN